MRPQFNQFHIFHRHAPTRPLVWVLAVVLVAIAGGVLYARECALQDALEEARNAPPYAVLSLDAVKGIVCVSCLEEAKRVEWKRNILNSK